MMKRMTCLMLVVCILSLTAFAEPQSHGGNGGRGDMALLNEGIAFLNGDGVAQDYARAMETLQSAYENGNMLGFTFR